MGIFKGSGDKAHGRQKQALMSEARQAGCHVVEVVDHGAASSLVGNTLTALVGGSVEVDALQVHRLQTNGWDHRFVQPFAGLSPVPGEHHGILAGCLPAPAILRQGGLFSGPAWDVNAGAEVAHYLSRAPALTAATAAIQWTWKLGFTKIDLDWALQARSIGDGTTHVVMQTGRYGGVTTCEVGFAQFLRVCAALHPCLDANPLPPQNFAAPVRYTGVLDTKPAAPPAAQQPSAHADAVHVAVDYTQTVRQALAPHLGKKVWVGSIPPKQLGNMQKHVLPPHLATVHILAAIDLTTFGSAKDAIVVTPTRFVLKELDEVITFELPALRAVQPSAGTFASKVGVDIDLLGLLQIPVGMDEAPVRALLEGLAAANHGATPPVSASAFVGSTPQGVSREQAQVLQQQMQASMGTDAVSDKINAAARLMTSGQFQAAAEAYAAIAQQHSETTGTCYGQIGAALFFMQQYQQAIAYYEAAKQYGADPSMMDDNIDEARGMLR